MDIRKHHESLQEVYDEISLAQQLPSGLRSHQRRLALMLSLGMCELIELYFHRLEVIKSGSRIKHDWFRQARIKEKIEQQIIAPIDSIKNIGRILELASAIEKNRDDIAYGSPLHDEKILQEKIIQFFEIKRLTEEPHGPK